MHSGKKSLECVPLAREWHASASTCQPSDDGHPLGGRHAEKHAVRRRESRRENSAKCSGIFLPHVPHKNLP